MADSAHGGSSTAVAPVTIVGERAVIRRKGRRPLSGETVVIVATRARMFAEPLRIRLLMLLDDNDATVQELADRLDAAHQTISKHLNLLYRAGMVSRRKTGREMHYTLVDYVSLWVIEQLANSAADHIEQLHELFAEGDG